jgi:hypothetical protein
MVVAALAGCGQTVFGQDRTGAVLDTVHGQRLVVDGGSLQEAARRAGLRLAETATPGAQTAPRPSSNWLIRHPIAAATLIGSAAGAALSRVDAIGGAAHDPRVTLFGTGAGAWGGLIASAVQKKRAGKKVGVGTTIGIAAGAVGLVVLPLLACYGAGGCGGTS